MKVGDLSIRPMFNILFLISIFQNLCYVFISMCLVSVFVPMLLLYAFRVVFTHL